MAQRALVRFRGYGGAALGVAVFGAVLAMWQISAELEQSFFFPPVSEVADRAVQIWPSTAFLRDVAATLGRMLAGYAVGSVAAVIVGVMAGASATFRRTVDPTMELLRALPPVTLVPAAVVILGFTDVMRVLVVAFGVFFPVYIASVDGVRNVPVETRETATTFRLTRAQTLRLVLLPAALPTIFAGLRIALSISFVMVVIAEMVGAETGLGHYILARQQDFDAAAMYCGLIFLGLLGYAANRLFLAIEWKVIGWHHQTTE